MLKKKVYLLFVFLFIFSLSFISSQPPFEPFESTFGQGLQFAYSPYASIKENTDFKLHIHLINDTEVQTNLTTSCLLHLYDSEGGHILKTYMDYEELEFEKTIAGGNFTVGKHAYIIECNNTNKQIELVSGLFEVTPSGNFMGVSESINLFGSLFLIILIATIFLIIGITSKNKFVKLPAYSISIIVFIMAILYTIIIVQQTLFGFENILVGLESFWFVMKMILSIFAFTFSAILLLVLIKYFKIKRGLLDS